MTRKPADQDPRTPGGADNAVAAAILHTDGVSQDDIAEILGVSQTTVSRLLKYAEDTLGVLHKPRAVFHPQKIGVGEVARIVAAKKHPRLSQAAAGFLHDALEDRLRALSPGGRFRSLTVVPSDPTLLPSKEALVRVLKGAKVLGVTWGSNIRRFVAALADDSRLLPGDRDPVRFFPACGEPFESRTSQENSSSFLAEELHRLWNPTLRDLAPPSISGVPAFIPQTFGAAEQRTIRTIIEMGAGYRQVFRSPDALVDLADTLLTSVGVPDPGGFRGTFLKERVQREDLDEQDLQWILGDLGGVIIGRDDMPLAVKKKLGPKIERLNQAWCGVRIEHYRAVAARDGESAGVAVVAMQANRMELVEWCVRNGLINTLIASGEVADGLAARLA